MARSAAPVMFASAESRLSPSPLNWYSALKFNTGRSWLRARSNCSSATRTCNCCWTMSGWKAIIWARLASQSGSNRASVGAVTGTIRRLSAGGRPRMLRSCRSVVMTSEVRVTKSRRNCSSRCCASATSARVPRPTSSSDCSRLRISSPRETAVSLLQSWTCCWERLQYCCSMERTLAMTSALNRQTAASALSRAMTIGARLASRPAGAPACCPGSGALPSKGWTSWSCVLVV